MVTERKRQFTVRVTLCNAYHTDRVLDNTVLNRAWARIESVGTVCLFAANFAEEKQLIIPIPIGY